MMRLCKLCSVLTLSLGLFCAAAAAAAPDGNSHAVDRQLLLRAAAAEVEPLAAQYGLTVVARSAADPGLALVEGPPGMSSEQVEELLAGDHDVDGVEPAALAALPGIGGQAPQVLPVDNVWTDLLKTGETPSLCAFALTTAAAWSGYAEQEAAQLIRVQAAQQASADCGDAVVAVIDTGVDPDHPMLRDVLVPGYDFLTEEAGTASDWNNLDQSVQVIVEQEMRMFAEQSVQVIVEGRGQIVMRDEGIAPIVDPQLASSFAGQQLPPFFGHGTMVAGLIHLVAPNARLMPLRVFDGTGTGHVFDIVRAIHYAVDNGADVINMSFSMDSRSRELQDALQYARSRGVVCVAAGGNDGEHTAVYPAAFSGSLGIASIELNDTLSDFSNYGAQLIDLGAPGSGVITTFPGGLYAAGWGTSFSTPLVAGAAALIEASFPGGNTTAANKQGNALAQGSTVIEGLAGDLGSGRLDVLGAWIASQH